MKTYPFSALFSRMKYITRWCLMRSTRGPAARGRSHSGHLPRCTGDSDW